MMCRFQSRQSRSCAESAFPASSLSFVPDGRMESWARVRSQTLNYWLRKLELRDSDNKQAVVHGFRASFRSWNLQDGRVPGEAAEAALAHRGSPTVRAYLRDGPLFDVRVGLMQNWADYVLPSSSR